MVDLERQENIIVDCINGRDYMSLDLSGETAIAITLDDRVSTVAKGGTRLVYDEVGALYDLLGEWLARVGARPLGKPDNGARSRT